MADADHIVPTSTDPSPDQDGVKIRLIDTPQHCQLALVRLAQSFSSIEASEPYPMRGTANLVRVYATARF
jgi:hypothetical protein